jgi:LysR family transcriptional regulator, glycine cleavage system transcriptional activator
MKRATPTTQSLLAFAASARHLSFTKAGLELCVTQGAVSRQVAGLEEFVRVPLFERLNPGLELTVAGRSYLPRVEAALRDLETATLDLLAFGGMPNQISVACHPTLATTWLLPRLTAFRARFANVTLNLLPPVWNEPLPANVDIAIRFGDGVWPGLDAHYLLGREFVAVSAPAIRRERAVAVKKSGRAHKAADKSILAASLQTLASSTLLHHVQVPDAWPDALAIWNQSASGGAAAEPLVNPFSGPRFAQFSTLLQAAAAGLGTAIVPLLLAEDDLKSGRLQRAVPTPAVLSKGYFACCPQGKRSNTLVQDVVRWMLDAAQSPLIPTSS